MPRATPPRPDTETTSLPLPIRPARQTTGLISAGILHPMPRRLDRSRDIQPGLVLTGPYVDHCHVDHCHPRPYSAFCDQKRIRPRVRQQLLFRTLFSIYHLNQLIIRPSHSLTPRSLTNTKCAFLSLSPWLLPAPLFRLCPLRTRRYLWIQRLLARSHASGER